MTPMVYLVKLYENILILFLFINIVLDFIFLSYFRITFPFIGFVCYGYGERSDEKLGVNVI